MSTEPAPADVPPPAGTPPVPADETAFGLRRGDQLFLGVLVAAALVLTAVHWARLSGWGLREIEIERMPGHRYEYRLDINRATWVEWMQIEAIGETLARRIVADRETNGPFARVDDLRRVKGIGARTLERIRLTLTVGAPAATPRVP